MASAFSFIRSATRSSSTARMESPMAFAWLRTRSRIAAAIESAAGPAALSAAWLRISRTVASVRRSVWTTVRESWPLRSSIDTFPNGWYPASSDTHEKVVCSSMVSRYFP